MLWCLSFVFVDFWGVPGIELMNSHVLGQPLHTWPVASFVLYCEEGSLGLKPGPPVLALVLGRLKAEGREFSAGDFCPLPSVCHHLHFLIYCWPWPHSSNWIDPLSCLLLFSLSLEPVIQRSPKDELFTLGHSSSITFCFKDLTKRYPALDYTYEWSVLHRPTVHLWDFLPHSQNWIALGKSETTLGLQEALKQLQEITSRHARRRRHFEKNFNSSD